MTFRCPSSLVILLSPHISVKGDWNKRSTKCVIVTTWTWRPTHHLGQRLDRGRTQQRSRGRSRGGRWALSNAPGNPPQGFYIHLKVFISLIIIHLNVYISLISDPPQRLYLSAGQFYLLHCVPVHFMPLIDLQSGILSISHWQGAAGQ